MNRISNINKYIGIASIMLGLVGCIIYISFHVSSSGLQSANNNKDGKKDTTKENQNLILPKEYNWRTNNKVNTLTLAIQDSNCVILTGSNTKDSFVVFNRQINTTASGIRHFFTADTNFENNIINQVLDTFKLKAQIDSNIEFKKIYFGIKKSQTYFLYFKSGLGNFCRVQLDSCYKTKESTIKSRVAIINYYPNSDSVKLNIFHYNDAKEKDSLIDLCLDCYFNWMEEIKK